MKPLSPHMEFLILETVRNGLSDGGIWQVISARCGPAGYNVVMALIDRGLLDYFEGNRGQSLRATDKARELVEAPARGEEH